MTMRTIDIDATELAVIRDFIAEHWEGFEAFAKQRGIDPEAVYQQIGGQEEG
jgi:hypothetical protein